MSPTWPLCGPLILALSGVATGEHRGFPNFDWELGGIRFIMRFIL